MIDIIVCNSLGQGLDFVLEDLTAKSRLVGNVQGKVDGYNLARPDFPGSSCYSCWSEKIESADLFVVSKCYSRSDLGHT